MPISKQDAIGKKVLVTIDEPGKRVARYIDKIKEISNVLILLENSKHIFYLNGKGVDSQYTKLNFIDPEYAELLNSKWEEQEKKKEIIDYLVNNSDKLFILRLEKLQEIKVIIDSQTSDHIKI